MTTAPALDVAGLRVAYGDLVAVWEASLELAPGRITALVGRNGAGKTTLLSGICGILPARSGTVALDGRDITGLPPWKRVRRGMAIVQEGKQVFRDLSVHDNLRVGLRRPPLPTRRGDSGRTVRALSGTP